MKAARTAAPGLLRQLDFWPGEEDLKGRTQVLPGWAHGRQGPGPVGASPGARTSPRHPDPTGPRSQAAQAFYL